MAQLLSTHLRLVIQLVEDILLVIQLDKLLDIILFNKQVARLLDILQDRLEDIAQVISLGELAM